MNLSNLAYDRLKLIVQVILPGLAALYVGLAQFWEDLPKPEAVAGTIALVATFLGLFLNRSSAHYEGAGDLVVTADRKDGEVYLSADLNNHPGELRDGENVTLNVRRREIA